jgi:hypothetical protein
MEERENNIDKKLGKTIVEYGNTCNNEERSKNGI